jgi:hyperosmotically inducible periplasmic protein
MDSHSLETNQTVKQKERTMTSLRNNAFLTFLLSLCLALSACAAGRTTGETIDDSTTASSVKMKLLDDAVAPGGSINVEVYKGTVQLIGFVRTPEQEKAAMERAKAVDGVAKVVDAMVVVPEERSFGRTVDDQTIQTKVKFDLGEVGAGEAVSVVTDVRNGEVLLGGFVNTSAQRAELERIANGVEGVTRVHNFIGVREEL